MPTSDTDRLLSAEDSNAITKLRTYLSKKSFSFSFDLRPLARARVVNERGLTDYVAHLWTLKETRWTSDAKVPYYGDELLFHHTLGNIWDDYDIDRPTKTVLNQEETQEVVHDLIQSRRREPCSKCQSLGKMKCLTCSGFGAYDCKICYRGAISCCQMENCWRCKGKGSYMCSECLGYGKINCPKCVGQGSIPCSDCAGLRFIVTWKKLHIKWENQESTITQDRTNSSILPASILKKSLDKVICFEFDDNWQSTQSIDNVLHTCDWLPQDLRANICKIYQKKHNDKSERIIRLRCIIECLHIKEIDYMFNRRPGNTISVNSFSNYLIYFSM